MDIFSLVGKITINYSDAVNNIEKVSKSAEGAAEELEDVDEKADGAGKSVKKTGEKAKSADGNFTTWKATLANLASNAITKVVDGCTDLAKSVVSLGEEFSSTMSEVQAISGASDEQMAQLEATAREYGATTVFSATEAAEALKYMSLAGWSVEESTSALGGVLDLAAASGMELGQASDMVTDYLSAFGMEADQAAYFADMLAYAQSNSNTTAEQLGEAYRNCAANLNAAGQDVETTTSLLEAMANQGYKGSEAGTALAAIMRDITSAMQDGSIKIGDTSVSVMDANGNFRDLTDILTDVENATNGMGDAEKAAALSSTFTSDSTKGLNLILNEGMEDVAGYEDSLRNADGAASDMADTMNDNLGGDIAEAKSAFEELGLKIYDKLEQPLRDVVQFVTDEVVPKIETLVENFDKIAPVIAAAAAGFAALKTVMAISSLISAVSSAWKAYQTANEGATAAQWLFNAAMNANPAVLIITIIAALVAAIVVLWNTNDNFRNAVINIWETIKEAFSAAIDAVVGYFSGLVENIQAAWETLKETVSTNIEVLKEFFTNLVESIKQAWENIKNAVSAALQAVLTTVSTVWNTIKTTISNIITAIWTTISNVFTSISTTVYNILNGIKTTFSNIWNGIKTVVSNVIDGIKTTISNKLNAAKSVVSDILGKIKDKFQSIFDGAKEIVKNAIDKIKGFFNFKWSLPSLKMPHFSVSGKFSLNPPSIPKFSIDWYKKAMNDPFLFTQPTAFGINPQTGSLRAAGEAGDEMMYGHSNLMNDIGTAVEERNNAVVDALNDGFNSLLELFEEWFPQFEGQLVLDTGVLVSETASQMDKALGKLQTNRNRGR